MNGYSEENREVLKQKAQQLLRGKEELSPDLYNKNLEELVENLQVYQFELEMQNEELRRVQSDLAVSEQWFQSIFDLAPMGYCLLDREGTIIQCNQAFYNLFKLYETDVCGRKMREFVEPGSQDDFYFHLKKVESQKEKASAFIGLKSADRTIHVKLLTSLVSFDHRTEDLMLCSVNDISREVSYYNKLKISEDRFRSLVNSMDDVIFTIDTDLKHSSVHGRWIKQLGMKKEDFLGKRATEIMGQEAGVYHEKYFRKALQGESVVYEWNAGSEDELQYFQTSLSPIYEEDGTVKEIVGVGRDVTADKINHFELQERVKEQKCLYGISRTLQDYHAPIDQLLQRCAEIIPSGFRVPGNALAAIIAGDMIFFSDEAFDFENEKCLKSQVSVDEDAYAEVFVKYRGLDSTDHSGAEFSFLEEEQQLIDIIARNIVQALKNHQSKQELNGKNQKLDQLNAEKDRMISILAHDLRSPLSSVLGLVGLMDERFDSMTSGTIKGYLEALNKSTKSYYKLLENLLEWASLQRGGMEMEPRNHQVEEIVKEAVELNLNIVEDKDISIKMEIDPEIYFKADKTSILSVFNNLLSNAVKFSQREGIVTIKAVLDGNMVICSVCDQGIGINEEMQQKLFKIDADVKRMGTEKELSTGLGLLICKELVEINGGGIRVESTEDKGSCFFFTVPAFDETDEK